VIRLGKPGGHRFWDGAGAGVGAGVSDGAVGAEAGGVVALQASEQESALALLGLKQESLQAPGLEQASELETTTGHRLIPLTRVP
jgi:hypothetical protein